MTTYVMRAGKLVEKYAEEPARVALKCDALDAFESPVTGEIIGSRGQWDRHLKEHGHHISEPGDVAKRPAPDRRAIEQAVRRASEELGI